jgi:hypothetical protein
MQQRNFNIKVVFKKQVSIIQDFEAMMILKNMIFLLDLPEKRWVSA